MYCLNIQEKLEGRKSAKMKHKEYTGTYKLCVEPNKYTNR